MVVNLKKFIIKKFKFSTKHHSKYNIDRKPTLYNSLNIFNCTHSNYVHELIVKLLVWVYPYRISYVYELKHFSAESNSFTVRVGGRGTTSSACQLFTTFVSAATCCGWVPLRSTRNFSFFFFSSGRIGVFVFGRVLNALKSKFSIWNFVMV